MVVGPGLALPGCTAVLDVESYNFVGPDAAPQQIPALPLGPIADVPDAAPSPPGRLDAAQPIPAEGESSVEPLPLKPPPIEPPPAEPPPAEPPPAEPPPAEPLPRPVVVGEPTLLAQLAGSPTGGQPRAATCPDGVIYGLFFQYYTSVALEPDRLTYVWPICSRLEPATPNLADGEAYDAVWPISSLDDPVFAPLRENELIGGLTCPIDEYLVGIQGSYDEPVGPSVGFRSFGILCASLNTDAERSDVVHGPLGVLTASGISPFAGGLPFEQRCPTGQAGGQLDLRFGNWLDAIGLRCSSVSWPFTAGHVCTTPEQCQSGQCGVDGVCAP
jgi:hypothetical protein